MVKNRNILIVESDPMVRRELHRALEGWGYAVFSVIAGAEARKKLQDSAIDMVIVGFETPGVNGIDLCHLAASGQTETGVLFLSNEAPIAEAVNVMKAGAFDFVMKPISEEQLYHLVQRWFCRSLDAESGRGHQNRGRDIVTQDPGMKKLLALARQVADSRASVLIQGESGTGKELFARYIHEHSSRRGGPFIAVNCGALPETLLESELFGHEKGAFTGAISRKPGKFELADGGTILLDEVTEMQASLQAKLLRVLQEREVDRLGGRMPVSVDIRVVATTNRDIKTAIEEKQFREDLYYRLSVIPLRIPPLRERCADIPLLAHHFMEKYNAIDRRNVKSLAMNAVEKLATLPFNGNVRELENMIERAVLLSDGHCIQEKDLFIEQFEAGNGPVLAAIHDVERAQAPLPLREVEKKMIFQALDETSGNRTHAAKLLGISVRTLRNKLNEYKDGFEAE
ncbi:MAG: sigma-54 dependent transcriptional regulator [Desulfobacterales bacterium]|nr:sigma-54 dependent transcriptional regulator [Desulfobacterales bacterium]